MEKLDKKVVQYFQRLIKTCAVCGIESVAIEKEVVRGQSEDHTKGIFLIEKDNIPDLPFPSLGIGRVKTLGARINILDADDLTISYDGSKRDNGDLLVKKLLLANKRTKLEYSCYDALKIKAPRNFKDDFVYKFIITEETLKIMSKSMSIIESPKVSFSTEKDGSVKFRASDTTGDSLDHLVSDSYEIDTDKAQKEHFFNPYEIKYVLPLFKAAADTGGEIVVNMSNRGIIKVTINGFEIYVLPAVN